MAEGVPSIPKRFLVRTFYLFIPIESSRLQDLSTRYRSLGCRLNLSGGIIFSPEGLNSTVAGRKVDVYKFFSQLLQDFPGITPQDSYSFENPFKRWKVMSRASLVRTEFEHSPANNYKHQIEPAEWDEIRRLVGRGEAQMIDVRNAYEVQIGTFPEALSPGTSSYQEFSYFLDGAIGTTLNPDLPTAIFCTGGIRCEKARLELKARGFAQVWPLKGGILNYLKEDTEEGFEGECFVFDLRVSVDRHLSPTVKYKTCPRCGGATPVEGEPHECTRGEVLSERR